MAAGNVDVSAAGGRRARAYDYVSGRPRPVFRGVIHAVATPVTAVGGALLTAAAHGIAIVVSLIFAMSMLVCFGVSAGYHIAAKTRSAQRFMQRLDHAAINVALAGSATPIFILGVPTWWSPILLGFTWLGALLGFVLKVTARGWRLASGLYLLTGWSAACALPALWFFAGPLVASLVLAGGVIYTVGAVLFWTHRLDWWSTSFGFHEWWHVLTVIGAATHFAAVALLVLR